MVERLERRETDEQLKEYKGEGEKGETFLGTLDLVIGTGFLSFFLLCLLRDPMKHDGISILSEPWMGKPRLRE